MIKRLQNWLTQLTLSVSAVLIGWVVIFVLYGVGSRYFIGSSPIWFDELARYSIIASAMIPIGAVWVNGGHMRVNILENFVSPSVYRVIVLYQWLLALGLSGLMAWCSYHYVGQVGFFKTPGLQISRSIPVALMPLGFGLLFFLVLINGPKAIKQPAVEEDS